MENRTFKMNERRKTVLNENATRKRWYVLRTISRREIKAKEYIDAMLSTNSDFAKYVSRVLVPTEEAEIVRNGKVSVKTKVRYAGYIFIEAELAGNIQMMLQNVPNVIGFLTYSKLDTKPMPLTPQEVIQLLGDAAETNRPTISFQSGEMVKVTDGPFSGFHAQVEEADSERGKLKVTVKIFGRSTPLELSFRQVEKQ